MRALVVFPFIIDPEGGAAARCGIGLLRGLAECGVEAHALVGGLEGRQAPEPPAGLSVETVGCREPSLARDRFDRFARPYSTMARGIFLRTLRERARTADVVHLVGVDAGSLLPHLDRPALAQLDCVTERDRDIGHLWSRQARTTIELLRAERRTVRRARWVLASSEEVADWFRAARPALDVTFAPLALDPSAYGARGGPRAPVAGLIGTAGWPPTANAVERLLGTIWPRVLERAPDARLRLAGRGMQPASFAGVPTDLPGVEWLGEVPSAVGFLREIGLLVYPLGRGSGAKIKVLEALACGVPVVTTPDGAEGIGAHGGLAVHASDGALVDATVALIESERARLAAGREAAATFDAFHTPEVAARPVVELYRRMASAT